MLALQANADAVSRKQLFARSRAIDNNSRERNLFPDTEDSARDRLHHRCMKSLETEGIYRPLM